MNDKDISANIDIKDMSFVVNQPYISYVFKKTQKISQALFMVTDSFENSEPLRHSIRKAAARLVEEGVSLVKGDTKDRSRVSNDLLGSLFGIISFCQSAYYIRLVSEMNFSILKEELESVIRLIETQKDKGLVLSRSFLDAGTFEDHKGHLVEHKRHDIVLENKPEISKPKATVLKADKSDRSKVIISLLAGGKELTIKDITSHLKGISEKTVQRELLSMAAQGILSKKGERRWSRYSLK